MIRPGRVVFVCDEVLDLVAKAAGLETYVFRGDCRDLYGWLGSSAGQYDVIVYLDTVVEACADARRMLEAYSRERLLVELEHPLKKELTDPRRRYREVAKKDLGVEVEL